MVNEEIKISVIIPVYNVYEWIDQCLESIVNQSFKDFEVLLIDDGSTDNSDHKCEQWCNSDRRVRMIKQQNAGPSAARNTGIKEAHGEYLAFIDADDWIDKDFLLDLYSEAEKENADVAECDIWRFNNKTGEKTYHACYGCMQQSYTKIEHMVYGHTAIWKCLFRRRLFLDYNILFPSCHSEARAVYALLIALANNVVNVRKPLYYYRRLRKNSLSEKPREGNEHKNEVGVQAFAELLDGFKRCGIYDENVLLLEKIVNYKLSDILCGMFTRREENDIKKTVEVYIKFISDHFPNNKSKKYFVFGGYNLNRITWLMNMLHIPLLRFNFSGLISITHPAAHQKVKCANKYREIMVHRDISSEFWNILKREQPQYLIMDLIEERFDVIEFGNGYITKSDAYDECEIEEKNNRVINRNSEEFFQLWQKCCCEFIRKLRECQPKIEIILVKNYLSEYYGNVYSKKSYKNRNWIQNMNFLLQESYDFFIEHCEFVKVIEASCCNYYYTDEAYEYGVEPAHLNEIVNREISKKIEQIMDYQD